MEQSNDLIQGKAELHAIGNRSVAY